MKKFDPCFKSPLRMQNGEPAFAISPFHYFTIFFRGGIDWNRTSDTRIFSPLLYHLSYDAKNGLQI